MDGSASLVIGSQALDASVERLRERRSQVATLDPRVRATAMPPVP